MSRRAVDSAILSGRVTVNGTPASVGQSIDPRKDQVKLDSQVVTEAEKQTIMLNKPVDYVCSREGQGSKTIYDLLPPELHQLKPIGRLDKDSSGLLLLTNNGDFANQMSHPSFIKQKVYQVLLNKPLQPLHQQMISDNGIMLDDGPSKLILESQNHHRDQWQVTMHEGRNRQIRRTFDALGYTVTRLHRTKFGPYNLDGLKEGKCQSVITEV